MSQPKMAAPYAASLLDVSIQAIHKQYKTLDIQLPKIGNKSFISYEYANDLFGVYFKRAKIAFQIVKGGTGKTTALHNICCCVNTYGAKVLAIDVDPQGNLTDTFNINADNSPVMVDILNKQATIRDSIVNVYPGIDLLPSRIENVVLDNQLALGKKPLHTIFERLLDNIEEEYDYVFIDCPPTMSHVVTAAALYCGFVLTPLNPDKYSAKGLYILKEELENIKKEYGMEIDYKVFLNKFSGNTILSDKAISTIITEETENGKSLQTAIRQSQEIPNCVDLGINLFTSLKKSTAREDFDQLTRELLEIDVKQTRNTKLKSKNNAMIVE